MSYFQNRGNRLIFNPASGTQDPSAGVYTVWADLADALQGLPGRKYIEFVGLCAIPAGTYDMTEVSFTSSVPSADPALVTTAIGCTLTGLRWIENMFFGSLGSASVDDWGTTQEQFIIKNASCQALGSAAAFSGRIGLLMEGGEITTGASAFFDVGSISINNITLSNNAALNANVIAGSGSSSLSIIDAGASTIGTQSTSYTGTLSTSVRLDSTSVAYDNVASGLTGENVQDAIDDLALRPPTAGETGPTGPTGPTGEAGPTGADGSGLLDILTTGITGEITTEDMAAATAGGITLTLPAAATAGNGAVVYLKDKGGNAGSENITIEGNGSETIDGALTFVLNVNYQSITVVSDGSNWMIV